MGFLDTLLGTRPDAPEAVQLEEFGFEKQDVAESAKKAVGVSAEIAPDVKDLLADLNAFQSQQAIQAKESAIPGFRGFQESLGGIFDQLTEGNIFELPEAFKDVLRQQAAERGVSGGFAGSEFGEFDAIRNFGKEAFGFAQSNISQAQNILQTLSATAPNISPISPLNFIVTPSQVLATDIQQESQRASLDAEFKIRKQAIEQGVENIRASRTGSEGLISQIAGAAESIGDAFSSFSPTSGTSVTVENPGD